MENKNHSLHLLLLITLTMLTTTNQQPTSPSPSSSPSPSLSLPPPPPPTPPSPPTSLEQLNNIIDALIGAGDFSSWVTILSMANPKVLPVSATLFIPEDTTFLHNHKHPSLDPFLFPYHVVPQRLTFSDLLLLPSTTHLPTLLPGKSISVTDNSTGNFSLDGTPLTHPDLYVTASIAVHGVANVLDYSLFGDGIPSPPPSPSPEETLSPPFIPIGWRSSAGDGPSCWCTRVNVVFLIFCWFVFVLQELTFGCIACH